MSLHIESTEEVLAELKRQRAKSLAAAISVSFLGVALMGLLLYLVNIITAIPEEPAVTVYPMEERRGEDPIKPEITRPQRPSSPPPEIGSKNRRLHRHYGRPDQQSGN